MLLKTQTLDAMGYMPAHFGRLPAGFTPDQYLAFMKPWLVQDRFHLSEVVYRIMDGGSSQLDPETYRFVDGALRLVNGFTIVITAEDAVLRQRYDGRGDDLYALDAIQHVNNIFRSLVTRPEGRLAKYQIDWDWSIHLRTDRPNITDEDIDNIMLRYMERVNTTGTFSHVDL